MATIGENIKKLREKNGMSQSELAAKIGKSRTAVWQYERGDTIPRMGAIEEMARVFGVKKSAIIESRTEYGFLNLATDDERELMLVAFIDGKHIGNCSLMRIAPYKRYNHRCDVAIALYKEYCGCGIGKAMLQTILDVAKSVGYEQAELEVMAENKDAIAMYEKLGFQKLGTFPDNMKYADGSYMDAYWMMKKL